MSSGQRPRRRPFFPKMKDRGRKRGVPRITWYDSNFQPIWPWYSGPRTGPVHFEFDRGVNRRGSGRIVEENQ